MAEPRAAMMLTAHLVVFPPAVEIDLDGVPVRVIQRANLLHEKIRAGADPARRGSKRLQDFADAKAILEETPELRAELSEAERALLDALPGYACRI